MGKESFQKKVIDSGAFKTGEFILTSGRKSDFYVDIKYFSCSAEGLKEYADYAVEVVDFSKYDKIACVELGGVPLGVALSLKTGLDYVIVRKKERTHGTGKQIEGVVNQGDKLLFADDVMTTGGSVVTAIDNLTEAGGIVEDVLIVVNREEGGDELLKEKGLYVTSMCTANELKKIISETAEA